MAAVTRAAEQALLAKSRSGQPITAADHIATLDSAEEVDAFRAGLSESKRLTEDLIQAIARRKVQIARQNPRA